MPSRSRYARAAALVEGAPSAPGVAGIGEESGQRRDGCSKCARPAPGSARMVESGAVLPPAAGMEKSGRCPGVRAEEWRGHRGNPGG